VSCERELDAYRDALRAFNPLNRQFIGLLATGPVAPGSEQERRYQRLQERRQEAERVVNERRAAYFEARRHHGRAVKDEV
jgi:hypothetical protein